MLYVSDVTHIMSLKGYNKVFVSHGKQTPVSKGENPVTEPPVHPDRLLPQAFLLFIAILSVLNYGSKPCPLNYYKGRSSVLVPDAEARDKAWLFDALGTYDNNNN